MQQIPVSTIDDATAVRVADLFDSFSDPTRARIVAALLDGEQNVGDLVLGLELSKSAVSHQLRLLRDRRVIRARKQGRQVYVALDDSHITELFERGLSHILHE
jgi:ArsR family transcriptional regulator, lead/cadmium/zinc/bismuth-responsive transcriptional repressor